MRSWAFVSGSIDPQKYSYHRSLRALLVVHNVHKQGLISLYRLWPTEAQI